MGLSLPGIILFSPVFITSKKISVRKAKEALAASLVKIKAKDVISTWKILVALVLAPALYILFSYWNVFDCQAANSSSIVNNNHIYYLLWLGSFNYLCFIESWRNRS